MTSVDCASGRTASEAQNGQSGGWSLAPCGTQGEGSGLPFEQLAEMLGGSQVSEPETEKPRPDTARSLRKGYGLASFRSSKSKASLHTVDLDIPHELCCPITQSLFHDPVVNSLGETYDRQAIESYWATGVCRDPLSNQEVLDTRLVPNLAIRRIVQDFLEKNPKYTPDGWICKEMAPADFGAGRAVEPIRPTSQGSDDRCGGVKGVLLIVVFCVVCIFVANFARGAEGHSSSHAMLRLHSGVFRSLPATVVPRVAATNKAISV